METVAHKTETESAQATKRNILPVDCLAFAKHLAGFATLAADDSFNRPSLSCIRVTSDGHSLTLTATNGHILGCKRYILDGTSDESPQVPLRVMIPLASVKGICSALRQYKSPVAYATITYQDREVYHADERDHPGGLYFGHVGSPMAHFIQNEHDSTWESRTENYPEIARVCPKGPASLPTGRIGFNVNLFAQYFKAIYGKGEHKITVQFQDEHTGFRIIDHKDPELYLLVMPLGIESTDEPITLDAPTWVK